MPLRDVASVHRYTALDGLRGVAAVCVMLYHAGGLLGRGHLLPQGRLAVDFFFILSGFVIASSYEGRLRSTMSFTDYCVRRAIRLYPMIVCGAALGLTYFLLAPQHDGIPLGSLPSAFASAVSGLPTLDFAQGWTYYPLDPPEWSITFEIVLSVMFAAWVRWLGARGLLVLAALAVGPFLLERTAAAPAAQQLGPALLQTAARTTLPFLLGVLLHRAAPALPRLRLPVVGLLFALALTFAPPTGGRMWIYELACVLVVYPLIVVGGISCRPTRRQAKALDALGRLSYPLYLVHWPVLGALRALLGSHGNGHLAAGVAILIGSSLSIAVAAAALLLYDEPVRRRLASLTGPRDAASVRSPRISVTPFCVPQRYGSRPGESADDEVSSRRATTGRTPPTSL